jgi:4-hydroxy-tetrahydrodipicolinate synthase
MAAIYAQIPAVVAVKEGVQDSTATTPALHAMAPELVIWECDTMVYEVGWLQDGIVGPAQLGTSGYLFETPDDKRYSTYWQLIWDGKLSEARAFQKEHGSGPVTRWVTAYPGRPGYFTHWGEAFKLAASELGLPTGEYPYSRPPQALLPEQAKAEIKAAAAASGLAGGASGSKAVSGALQPA